MNADGMGEEIQHGGYGEERGGVWKHLSTCPRIGISKGWKSENSLFPGVGTWGPGVGVEAWTAGGKRSSIQLAWPIWR
jgi:hypothetical protein